MSDSDTDDAIRLLHAIRAVSATSADRAGDEGTLLDRVTAHTSAIRDLGEVLEATLSEDERRRLMGVLMDEFTDRLDPQAVEAAEYIIDGASW